MLLMNDYFTRVKNDAYGGSIELVEDAILAFQNELSQPAFRSAEDVAARLEACVDALLMVATSVLPLINLLIRCLQFAERCRASGQSGEQAAAEGRALLGQIRERQDSSTARIGQIGANMLRSGDLVGTFSTSGSVMAIVRQALAQKKSLSAVCFESRPRSEGFRTFRELSELGVPTRFGVDALLCMLVPKNDIFFIGADAIRSTGEVFAKTGSYLAALACREFGVPFYVAADMSKFDALSLFGYPLKDSSRPKEEAYPHGIPSGSDVVNVSFELIPPRLIDGIITENGLLAPTEIAASADMGDISAGIVAKLGAWVQSARGQA